MNTTQTATKTTNGPTPLPPNGGEVCMASWKGCRKTLEDYYRTTANLACDPCADLQDKGWRKREAAKAEKAAKARRRGIVETPSGPGGGLGYKQFHYCSKAEICRPGYCGVHEQEVDPAKQA